MIWHLLPPGARSAWHAVRSAELWLYHSGSPLPLLLGGPAAGPCGDPEVVTLGPDLAAGTAPRPSSRPASGSRRAPRARARPWSAVSSRPGFDFADFTALGGG